MAAAEQPQDLALTEVCEECGAKFATKQKLGAHRAQKHGYRNPDRKRGKEELAREGHPQVKQEPKVTPREWGEKVEEKAPRKRGRPRKAEVSVPVIAGAQRLAAVANLKTSPELQRPVDEGKMEQAYFELALDSFTGPMLRKIVGRLEEGNADKALALAKGLLAFYDDAH